MELVCLRAKHSKIVGRALPVPIADHAKVAWEAEVGLTDDPTQLVSKFEDRSTGVV